MLPWLFILILCLIDIKCSEMADDQVGKDNEDGGERWENAQVPYIIDSNLTSKIVSEFKEALQELHKYTCISGDGCWSYVGQRPIFAEKGQPLSLGPECDSKGVILHELSHSLGFFHEHTRWDRDRYIILNAQNIDKSHIKQFNKRSEHKVDQTGTYDLNSILHYEESAFAIDPTVPTIIARDSKPSESFRMGQREHLSRMDIQKINRYYNCSDIVQVKKAIETGLGPSNIIDVKTEKMHSLKKPHSKSFYWFKSPSDFETRTGKKAPNWLKFVQFDDEAHEFPRAIQCKNNEESNCQDRSTECLELALRGECERKPGYMLRFCRRSCCNCSDDKCFDTTDERKFRTLCLGRFRNHITQIDTTYCNMDSTRQNALDFCPKTCFSCFLKPTLTQ